MIHIKAPETSTEWDVYYKIRFETLRKEWGQPLGSERLVDDETSFHALAYNDEGEAIGVCRMHFNSPNETQIRMMGVVQNTRTTGAGTALLIHFEVMAKAKGATTMVLEAREEAVGFYLKNGYRMVKPIHILWGLIPHFWMDKQL